MAAVRLFLLLSVLSAILLLPGCGGGRSGTNTGGGVRLEVFVANDDGSPVEGAIVTDEGTGNVAVTNEVGVAELEVRSSNEEYRVFVENGGVSASIKLNEEAPLEDGRSYLALIALNSDRQFELVSIVEKKDEGNQPTPTPIRTPTPPRPSPTPTPSGGSTQTPTPLPPTPIASPTPIVTPTQTATPTPLPLPVILLSSSGASGSTVDIEQLPLNGNGTPYIELSLSNIEVVPREDITVFSVIESRQNSQNFIKIGPSTLRVFLSSFRNLEEPVDITAQFFVRVQYETSTVESDKFELRFIFDGTEGEGSE